MNKEWMKSKKLWTAVGSLGFVILTDVFGIPIDTETYWAVIGIASSYILGQSHVDAKKATAEAEIEKEVIKAEIPVINIQPRDGE